MKKSTNLYLVWQVSYESGNARRTNLSLRRRQVLEKGMHLFTTPVTSKSCKFWFFFCKKKIPLSRRVGRMLWAGQWMSEWASEIYACHTNQIGSTINSQSCFLFLLENVTRYSYLLVSNCNLTLCFSHTSGCN